jgi:tetratricopeptide (TPR) repeat protein
LTDEQSIDVSLIYTQLALWLKPDFPVCQTLLGEIYEDTKRYEKAVAAYEKIDSRSPLRSSAEIQIAGNLDSLGKTDEALARIGALIAREPDNYDALVAKGNIERLHEKWTEAAASYTRALSRVVEPQASHWTVFYFRGIAYERAGEWAKAEPDFRMALKLQPDQASVLNYLGYSLIEKRMNLKEAMDMVRKAVDLKPNDGYIVDSLGWAHYQLGEYEEAVKHLERAVELKPEDPVINDHLGDAYWRVGRTLEAKFQWKHAKDNKPEPKDLEKIEKKLSEGLKDPPVISPAQNTTTPNKS